MIENKSKEQLADPDLQAFLEKLKGPCIPHEFGERLAEESVERHFPKW